MALIICPDCKKQISDRADICIGCGRPLKESKEKITAEIRIKIEELRQAKEALNQEREHYEANPHLVYAGWWEGHYQYIENLETEIKNLKNKL